MEREINELREIFATNYASNVIEFMLLGPEIRYYLQMALDKESKIILTKSLDSRNKSVLMRSPEEKTLSRLRRNVLAKVCRAFYRIKKEFYPELTDKFKPP